jgi:hypothetical protein
MLVLVTIVYSQIMTQPSAVYRPSVFSIPIPSPVSIDCDSVSKVHKSDVDIQVQSNNQERNPQNVAAFIMRQVNYTMQFNRYETTCRNVSFGARKNWYLSDCDKVDA